MAADFPLMKLLSLAFRQMSKPIANKLKNRAKESLFFRTYICMPPAQFYHWIEVNVKMKMLGLGKPAKVTKLNQQAAIDLGAELLGEGVIFTFAAASLIAIYVNQAKKAEAEELVIQERWNSMDSRIQQLKVCIDQQNTEINNLLSSCYAIQAKAK